MSNTVDKLNLWDKLQVQFEHCAPELNRCLAEIAERIKQNLRDHHISCTIKKRVKKRDSYYSKLKSAYKKDSSEDFPLTDLLGIRVVVPFLEDVNSVVEEFRKEYEILEKEDKRQSLSFKEFSYDSIHLLIPFPNDELDFIHGNQRVIEVQIRTTLQDAWAEVEHQLIYKTPVNYPNESVKRKMASLNANLTLSDIIFQEIRDYQKNLLQESETRMQMMQHKAAEFITHPMMPSSSESQCLHGELDDEYFAKHDFEFLLQKALSAHTDKDYKHAILLYQKAIEKGSQKQALSIAYNHLGMAYFMTSQYELAIRQFNLAISYHPKNERAYLNRGIIHQLKKENSKAISDFQESIDLRHDQVETWLHLCSCYLQEYDYTEALTAVNNAMLIDPQHPRVQALQREISEKLIP